jgi:hydroxyethylthiazole kinase-like uncharacterized protein yjeF
MLAMARLNLSEMQLMQRAADAALNTLLQHWPLARHIDVYCGPGNNGGDGYLLAAAAKKLGYGVSLITLGSPVSQVAQCAQKMALAQGLVCEPVAEQGKEPRMPRADVVIDALFGHGLARDIEPPLCAIFEQINQSSVAVFALDVPSGINSDSGSVMGAALRANLTLCFVAPKIGLLSGDGAHYAGDIVYSDLGIPRSLSREISTSYICLSQARVKQWLGTPREDSHKGHFGHLLIVGGQPGMPGAVILAALAAARSGAGRVTVATSEQHSQLIPQANPVLMTQNIGSHGDVVFPCSSSALLVGPGLGPDLLDEEGARVESWSRMVFECVLEQAQKACLPIIIDADGLNLLAGEVHKSSNWVLSPHPKEAARLLACDVAEIQSDRPRACRRIARQYGGVCILKGKGSLIADEAGRQAVCIEGNWGMATAGSGDVLSGVIGAFLALGLQPFEAACAAVYVHACAGDRAVERGAKRALLASDIVASLATVFAQMESASVDYMLAQK